MLISSKLADAIIESREIQVSEEAEATEPTSVESEEPIEIMGSYTFNPDEN
jgi:hypothetical protein